MKALASTVLARAPGTAPPSYAGNTCEVKSGHEVKPQAGWNRQNLRAIAFVQGQRDGHVLQAVSAAQCAPSATRGLQ